MPTGSCFCQNVKYEYTGDPTLKVACHCRSCKKYSSGSSITLSVPEDKFRFTSGKPKEYTTTHESGMTMKLFFCSDCNSLLSKSGDAEELRGSMIIFAGTLDDDEGLDKAKPDMEIYVKYRASWLPEVAGAKQMQEWN